ncbi:MAG: hypothetical protein ACN4GT_04400, partial [Gammaproteobacteria bacterium]
LETLLSYPLATFADQSITVGKVSLVLAILIGGYLPARGLERILVKRMTNNAVSPDLIHLVRRIYLVVVLAVLIITVLDLLRSNHGPVVMEVNSSPGLEGIETATGTNVAGLIIDFLEKNAKLGKTRSRGSG